MKKVHFQRTPFLKQRNSYKKLLWIDATVRVKVLKKMSGLITRPAKQFEI